MTPEKEVIKLLKDNKTFQIAQAQLLKQIYLELKKFREETKSQPVSEE